jgi:hypothetical protein
MSNKHLVRAVRQPLTWLVIVAVALLAMLALESTGAKHAPSAVPLSIVAHGNQANHPNDNKHKHCKDHHGHDAEHNKHCRGVSGG